MWITYEYQCRVKIFVILLREFPIVLFGLLAVVFIEFDTEIFLWQLLVLFLSVRRVNDCDQRDAKPSLPICCVPAWFHILFPTQYSSTILGFPRPWDPNCQGGKQPEPNATYPLLFFSFMVLIGQSSSVARICPLTSASRLQVRTIQSRYRMGSRRTHRWTVISSKSISAMMRGIGMDYGSQRGTRRGEERKVVGS